MQALQSMELGLTRREINSVLFQYDRNEDGHISYTEFVPFAFGIKGFNKKIDNSFDKNLWKGIFLWIKTLESRGFQGGA